MTINGERHQLDVAAQTPFIFVLRNDLNLVGTRLGCGLEQCGSCLVLADGEPIYSCTTTTGELAGKHILTVEGLAPGDTLHPIQQAFLDENAAQCGYCTGGIIMRATALLRDNPDPSDKDINAALDGHLCRCGAHPRILRAIRRAAQVLKTTSMNRHP